MGSQFKPLVAPEWAKVGKSARFRRKHFLRFAYRHWITGLWVADCCHCRMPLPFAVMTIEHLIARCLGGNNSNENIAVSCRKCNNDKGGEEGREAGRRFLAKFTEQERSIRFFRRQWNKLKLNVQVSGELNRREQKRRDREAKRARELERAMKKV